MKLLHHGPLRVYFEITPKADNAIETKITIKIALVEVIFFLPNIQ